MEHIGDYLDLNGSTVRVTRDGIWYFYETVDGPHDLFKTPYHPERHKDLRRKS